MIMKLFKISGWEKYFNPKILQRGKDYYLDDAVDELKYDENENTITATVYGTKNYDVEIGLTSSGKDIEYMCCDCPYAEDDNNCKHMAAVLYAFERNDFELSKKQEIHQSIEECIEKLSTEEMQDLLIDAVERDSVLRDKIFLKTNKTITKNQEKLWERELSLITNSAMGRDGYIEYRNAWDYTHELSDYMYDRVPELIKSHHLEEAMGLVCTVYDEALSVEMDDSDGGLTMLASDCMDYWNKILKQGGLELKRKVYPWFEKKDKNDLFVFDYKYSAFTEKEFLEKQLSEIDRLIENTDKDEFYYFENYISRRLELMQKLKFSEDEIKKYINKYRYLPEVRKKEIQEEISNKNYESAIELLNESKEMDKAEHPGLISNYCKELIHIYDITGRKEEYSRELTDYVLNERQDDLTYVYLLKDITPKQNWAEMREKIIESGKLKYIKFDFYVKEELYGRLFNELNASPSVYSFLQYEKVLKEHFPEKTRDALLAKIDVEMKCAATRGNYYTVITYLKKVRKYPNGEEMAQKLADGWKICYPRRTAMLDELKKAKF